MIVYYQINYTLTEVPEDCAYFHAQFRRTNPLPYKEVYTILDGVSGRGQYVGTYMAWGVNNTGWWGEGEIKFFIDGDGEFPTICGTGTEDYFCGAYNFDPYVAHSGRGAVQQSRYLEFTTPYAGLPQVIRPDGVYKSQQRFGLYRWHITDPIRFESDLRVTIQALGWRTGHKDRAISAAAGRHRLGRVLVPDAADRALPDAARRGLSRDRLIPPRKSPPIGQGGPACSTRCRQKSSTSSASSRTSWTGTSIRTRSGSTARRRSSGHGRSIPSSRN